MKAANLERGEDFASAHVPHFRQPRVTATDDPATGACSNGGPVRVNPVASLVRNSAPRTKMRPDAHPAAPGAGKKPHHHHHHHHHHHTHTHTHRHTHTHTSRKAQRTRAEVESGSLLVCTIRLHLSVDVLLKGRTEKSRLIQQHTYILSFFLSFSLSHSLSFLSLSLSLTHPKWFSLHISSAADPTRA